jgi:archaemetzincin
MKPWCLALMGAVEPAAVDAVEEALTESCFAAIERIALPEPDFAFDPARGQYGSVAVLQSVAEKRPPLAWKVLGLTGKDLFIPMLTFVYGQAQLGGPVGVVSLARLRQEFYGLPPDERVLIGRARKEALHEAGHLLGLVHCNERRCAMSLSTNVRQLDGKGAEYCPACASLVGRRRGIAERVEP